MPGEKILIVDDEKGVRKSLTGILEDDGFQAESVATGEKCLELLQKKHFALVLLDVWLPGMDGIETLRKIKASGNNCPVIMISGHSNLETAVRATKMGAFYFIEKPLSLEKTLLVVKNALKQHIMEIELHRLKEEMKQGIDIIGESNVMQVLKKQIAAAAPSDSRVLIYGENGTGKEIVARSIHYSSLRAEAPFIEVNCAAIPEELIESELFGHIKGSFTGASESKDGKFIQAHGGTLFLDEIADMSLKTQAKVLRVLETQKVDPVGGKEARNADVRVITATNKLLEEEIEAGSFRDDLYYRINVIPINVPPLRERTEDIPLLVEHFLNQFSFKAGKKKKQIYPSAMKLLQNFEWPGNVRELKNLIERLVIMAPSNIISADDLPPVIRKPHRDDVAIPGPFSSLKEARDDFERRYILELLQKHNNSVPRTAQELNIERSNLYRKMRYLNIKIDKNGG